MSEFWMWFWRPIAETLGVLALLAVLAIGYGAFMLLTRKRK